MEIVAKVPKDRIGEGQIFVDGVLMGRCRGKADNQAAIAHGNPSRDPTRPYGDHPAGRAQITEVRDCRPEEFHSYGPHKLVMVAVDGEAKARQDFEGATWDAIEGHGGDPAADGFSLRPTYGCLRMPNDVCKAVAAKAKAALANGEAVDYRCDAA